MHRLAHSPLRATRPLRSLAGVALLALSSLASVHAQGGATESKGATGIDASGDYRQEMQACMQGRTAQDRATCTEEARSARAANRRGALDAPSSETLARCEGMNAADQAACRARVMGYGNTSGSVAGGGILRELDVASIRA